MGGTVAAGAVLGSRATYGKPFMKTKQAFWTDFCSSVCWVCMLGPVSKTLEGVLVQPSSRLMVTQHSRSRFHERKGFLFKTPQMLPKNISQTHQQLISSHLALGHSDRSQNGRTLEKGPVVQPFFILEESRYDTIAMLGRLDLDILGMIGMAPRIIVYGAFQPWWPPTMRRSPDRARFLCT